MEGPSQRQANRLARRNSLNKDVNLAMLPSKVTRMTRRNSMGSVESASEMTQNDQRKLVRGSFGVGSAHQPMSLAVSSPIPSHLEVTATSNKPEVEEALRNTRSRRRSSLSAVPLSQTEHGDNRWASHHDMGLPIHRGHRTRRRMSTSAAETGNIIGEDDSIAVSNRRRRSLMGTATSADHHHQTRSPTKKKPADPAMPAEQPRSPTKKKMTETGTPLPRSPAKKKPTDLVASSDHPRTPSKQKTMEWGAASEHVTGHTPQAHSSIKKKKKKPTEMSTSSDHRNLDSVTFHSPSKKQQATSRASSEHSTNENPNPKISASKSRRVDAEALTHQTDINSLSSTTKIKREGKHKKRMKYREQDKARSEPRKSEHNSTQDREMLDHVNLAVEANSSIDHVTKTSYDTLDNSTEHFVILKGETELNHEADESFFTIRASNSDGTTYLQQMAEVRRRLGRPAVRKSNSTKAESSVKDRVEALRAVNATEPVVPYDKDAARTLLPHHATATQTNSAPQNSNKMTNLVANEIRPQERIDAPLKEQTAALHRLRPPPVVRRTESTKIKHSVKDRLKALEAGTTLDTEDSKSFGQDDDSEEKSSQERASGLKGEKDEESFERHFIRDGRVSVRHLLETTVGGPSQERRIPRQEIDTNEVSEPEEEENESERSSCQEKDTKPRTGPSAVVPATSRSATVRNPRNEDTSDDDDTSDDSSDDDSEDDDSSKESVSFEDTSEESEDDTILDTDYERDVKIETLRQENTPSTSYEEQRQESRRRYGRPDIRRTNSTQTDTKFSDRIKVFQK